MRHSTLLLTILLLTTGCAGVFQSSSNQESMPPAAPAQSSFYYDFKDIRIPEEMELQAKKSSITPTESGKSGVMRFQGRVEPISLFDFFYNTMPKDGWTLMTYQKYQRFLLVFAKEQRMSVITISADALYYTNLEIWVSPLLSGSFPSGSSNTGYDSHTFETYSSPAAPNSPAASPGRTLSE